MLTDRQNLILKQIVDEYSQTGEPVGSKSLAQHLPIKVSSATIRNEMSVLSQNHFIEQVHTSSGRIPSYQGYRYYVDNLTKPIPLEVQARDYITEMLDGSFKQLDDIVRQSADLLSQITDYTALTFTPMLQQQDVVESFRLTQINHQNFMAIMMMKSGLVQSQPFLTEQPLTSTDGSHVEAWLNQHLRGESLSQVTQTLEAELASGNQQLADFTQIVNAFVVVANKLRHEQFFVSGRSNLFHGVGAETFANLKPLYSSLSSATDLETILQSSGQDVSVRLGSELHNDLWRNYSIISGTYDAGAHGVGRIAVIGPTRMFYPRVMGLVDAFRDELQTRIRSYYHDYDQ
ncbi:heat-inducible transcriptional repressor HrcA [Fructilactobacillus carniphilus]|uniref:Heat-inducible transcription repressor HrcA n=1 Tax=Fructilactobacillus carniphilus TaxID=2940297 RepID=A0ABY5BWX6_9LACO|nr:heat-inducible transcriptional repressor HrcA [Fructilactobacillus carniphilus]USS91009.1 heat-inducible transcriptional repressor HrcA [Fructilactobacillus carniphilus]